MRALYDETVEIALLSFFEQIKYSFLSSEASGCVKMWEAMNKVCLIDSQEKLLVLIVTRILYFLNSSNMENIVVKAAEVFHELVIGVHSCKILQKPEILKYVDESGVFRLNSDISYQKSKVLMGVYESIGRYEFLIVCFLAINSMKIQKRI